MERKAQSIPYLARAASGVMCAASHLNHILYGRLIPKTHLSIPVISVGNIVAGGSGKTPFVRYLAEALAPRQIAILSRGYKRQTKDTLIVNDETCASACGDEPKLLKEKLPSSIVIAEKNRSLSGHLATALGAEVILLDDGFQHRRLHRDCDIVMIDGGDPFGRGHFLPYGHLRDDPRKLKKADLIALMGIADRDHFCAIKEKLAPFTSAPLTSMELVCENGEELMHRSVASFCAIASPHRFQRTLNRLGCTVVLSLEKPDHDPFSRAELETFARQAKGRGAETLVCTEKDWVKLSHPLRLDLTIIPLKISLRPQFGGDHLESLINGVVNHVSP